MTMFFYAAPAKQISRKQRYLYFLNTIRPSSLFSIQRQKGLKLLRFQHGLRYFLVIRPRPYREPITAQAVPYR
jgi:hypothetical protein